MTIQTYEAKLDRAEGRNRKFYNEFNTPLSVMGRTPRQKISKEMEDLNTRNQLNLASLHSNSAQQQQSTYSSQIHIEHSARQTRYLATY